MMLTSLSISTGTSKARCTWAGTSYRSQPGMIGGLIARPVECSTGPGSPIPMAASSATVPVLLGQHLADLLLDPAEHVLGSEGDIQILAPLDQDRPGQVGQRDPRVGGADVGAGDHPGGRVEREQRRRSAAGGDPAAVRRHQAEPHQQVDPGGDRRAGQAQRVGQLGPGPGLAVPEQLEDVAGPHDRKCDIESSACPAKNFCRTLDRSG